MSPVTPKIIGIDVRVYRPIAQVHSDWTSFRSRDYTVAGTNVINSDTSLAMISASTRMAVLICAAPPLSANKPDRIWIENTVSTALGEDS